MRTKASKLELKIMFPNGTKYLPANRLQAMRGIKMHLGVWSSTKQSSCQKVVKLTCSLNNSYINVDIKFNGHDAFL